MEKLIELLNEREVGEEWWEFYYLSNGVIIDDWWNILYDYRIISKGFWFIKWLVENDMIDFKNNKLQVLKDIDVRWEVMYDYTLFDKVDWVIMLLSISDTQIEDLISLLK